MNNPIKIACLGESKVQQLSHDGGSQSFACFGDALTTAIYLVRSGLEVSFISCLLYTSPSPRDATLSRMPSSA